MADSYIVGEISKTKNLTRKGESQRLRKLTLTLPEN